MGRQPISGWASPQRFGGNRRRSWRKELFLSIGHSSDYLTAAVQRLPNSQVEHRMGRLIYLWRPQKKSAANPHRRPAGLALGASRRFGSLPPNAQSYIHRKIQKPTGRTHGAPHQTFGLAGLFTILSPIVQNSRNSRPLQRIIP